jgi:hypothetical protein
MVDQLREPLPDDGMVLDENDAVFFLVGRGGGRGGSFGLCSAF